MTAQNPLGIRLLAGKFAVVAGIAEFPWAMVAALCAAASLGTLWYVNFFKPRLRERRLLSCVSAYILVPRKNRPCSYAMQDDNEHLLKEISLEGNKTHIVDFILRVNFPFSYSEILIGFTGDNPDRKPQILRWSNRFVRAGRGMEADPSLQNTDDYIDVHGCYHRKVSNKFDRGAILSMAFTIETRDNGLYPLHIIFASHEKIGEITDLFVTVEPVSTVHLRCVDQTHSKLGCAKGIRPLAN